LHIVLDIGLKILPFFFFFLFLIISRQGRCLSTITVPNFNDLDKFGVVENC